MRTYKFRLYPTKEEKKKLGETLELCRRVYNCFLGKLNEEESIPSQNKLQSQLPNLKKKWSKLTDVYSKVLQMILHQLYSNLRVLSEMKKNGRKVGRLKFKEKNKFRTFTYNQSGFKIIETGRRLDLLKLSKIGKISICIHRKIRGEIKQIIIRRADSGKWFAYVQTNREENRKSGRGVVAIDLNTDNYLTGSDGRVIENPKFLKEKEAKLRKEQRKLSRKKKGSKNWEKQKSRVARVYEELADCRRDFIHKLTTAYVENYDMIILEDLNIAEMCKDSHYAKSNLDSSWGLFKQMLSYKAESAGVKVVFVNPKNTTQKCSSCGAVVSKHIRDRKHKCPECGFGTTRDYNSALCILGRGLDRIGRGQAEFTPVDNGASTPVYVGASSVIEAGSSSLTSEAS